MSMMPTQQTAADQVIVHGVGLLSHIWSSDDRCQLALGVLRETLPKATIAVPMMGDFVDVARDLIAAQNSTDHAAARRRAQFVLERMHQSRMASAWDIMRKTSGGRL
ncbi:hypothetical protein [Paenirhodobacter sp. CAU 1674]|uniref:hypothetical protein n=1 Tax=Paenirhodobacter sp. CAU 1674 TaxID=3032596 RepID=UPI0023DB8730|nr:hypothetical protein [Paenirhodobacter sp. CAU 1674]MDF2140844.1 hypothetical protein [Paenirhodobacter sp. CAU 1674]